MRHPFKLEVVPWAVLALTIFGAVIRLETHVDPPEVTGAQRRASATSDGEPVTDLGEYDINAIGRVVAIGDIHGDVEAMRTVLKSAGAIDDAGRWIGGRLVVVQTGDILDKGDDDLAVLSFLSELRSAAAKSGGAVHLLNGNHETMNVAGNFRYVAPKAFAPFRRFTTDAELSALPSKVASRFPEYARARAAALLPGGRIALQLAKRPVILKVDGSVFVHGGVLFEHVTYGISRINREVSAWMRGKAKPPRVMLNRDAPTRTRRYGGEHLSKETCEALRQVLSTLGAVRLVVGHVVQKNISSACDERVWRIDVGMSSRFDRYEALEIVGDDVRILR